jgi:hypothetical protein
MNFIKILKNKCVSNSIRNLNFILILQGGVFMSLFISKLESLKQDLRVLSEDKFTSSYKRINQPSAAGLLEEIEQLEKENNEFKEKLQKINDLSKQ